MEELNQPIRRIGDGLFVHLRDLLALAGDRGAEDPHHPRRRAVEAELVRLHVQVVQADKLGLNGSPTRVVRIFRPSVARQCEKITPMDEQAVADAADRLVEFLQQKRTELVHELHELHEE